MQGNERTMGFRDFFFLWFGAAVSLAEILTGGLFAPLGFWVGLLAIILGHLIGNTIFALGGVMGAREGLPAMISTRASFGPKGSYLGTILNALQLLGWTAVMLIVGSKSVSELIGPANALGNQTLWIILLGVMVTVWAAIGSDGWKKLNNIAAVLLFALTIVMSIVVFRNPSVFTAPAAGGMSFGSALELAIVMPISWLPLIADYTRFAKTTSAGAIGSWLGYFVGSCWMFVVGLGATLISDVSDPTPLLIAAKLGAAALLIIILATVTTTFMDVYSAAVTTLNILPKAKERTIVLWVGLVSTALALVFPIDQYENFLYLLGAVFTPLFGVVLADYFALRRKGINQEALYATEGSYWYWGGINWVAIGSWAVGFFAYQMAVKWDLVVGATAPALVVTATIYLLAMKLLYKQKNGQLKTHVV